MHKRNALYFAIRFWKPDIIKLLLDVKDVDLFQGYCAMLPIWLFIQYYDHKTSKDDRLLIQKICNKYTRSELVIDELIPTLMKEEARFMQLLEFYIVQQEGSGAAINLDTIKPKGKPLISYAVEYGYKQIFTTLCQYAHNIDTKGPSGRTSLSYAAESGSFPTFNTLLKKGADPQAQDSRGHSILHYALEGLNKDLVGGQCIVYKLLDHNDHHISVAKLIDEKYLQLLDVVLQNKTKAQWIPKLHIFDRCINQIKKPTHILNILNKLSKEDTKPYLQQADRTKRTLLSHFAQTGEVDLVKKLLEWIKEPLVQGTATYINQPDDMRRTPLFYALERRHIPTIEILLQNGANVNQIDQQKLTPLLYAIQNKCSVEVIKILLEYKANLSYCDQRNWGALSHAVDQHEISIVDLLLPKMIEEAKCHTELCIALFLAKDKNKTVLYNKLVNTIAPLFEQGNSQGWVDVQRSKKQHVKTIFYSRHAEERAQERDIGLDVIERVIRKPQTMQQSDQSDHILKLMANNICVVVARQKEKITVITTYRIAVV